MPKVKIISDPYKKYIKFEKWNDQDERWKAIDLQSDPSSELLCTEFTDGFFPFKVKKIVDIIIRDYKLASSKLELIFEGTEDEYEELISVCSNDYYENRINISRSDISLKNARDILPDVKNIFKMMKTVISETVKNYDKVESERRKFDDVSKEIIPLCVVGNYSSGKSTFINSLIGYEVLPSGDESLTAKIHEIRPSDKEDTARIAFLYNGMKSVLHFEEKGFNIFTFSQDSPLFQKINEEMKREADWDPLLRTAKVLEIINYYDKDTHDEKVDDLIQITVPFNPNSIFGKNADRYVIFDTPGSNSATNDKHILVLKKAMENLSNGIPLYVSEYNTLDSTDNEKLCNEIKEMEELDSRFAMIIVNKADVANLDKDHFSEDIVLNQAIPKNIYSEGLYFVSSILGLGSKTDGIFNNKYYGKIYRTSSEDYNDPDSPYYTRLYDFNILPEQIKSRSLAESEQVNNLVYANSGLYWIEKEIDTFARRYSSYNKCWQSLLFLRKVVDISFKFIEEKKKELESSREQRQKQLDKGKADLFEKIESKSEELNQIYSEKYSSEMTPVIEESYANISVSEIQDLENRILNDVKREISYKEHENIRNESWKMLGDSIRSVRIMDKEQSHISLKDITNMLRNSFENNALLKDIYDEVEKISSDRVLTFMTEKFKKANETANDSILAKSISFWTERSYDIRNTLLDIVVNSEALTVDKRSELSDIIMKYEEPDMNILKEVIFNKSDFQNFAIKLGDLKLFGDYKINKNKLTKFYNIELKSSIDVVYGQIRETHILNFNKWKQELLNSIESNITELNSDLKKLFDLINKDKNDVLYLESRKTLLAQYSDDIENLMKWSEEDMN